MIYIKTDMAEMPKTCFKCDRWRYENCGIESIPHCHKSRVNLKDDKRPDWCPLVEKEDIK